MGGGLRGGVSGISVTSLLVRASLGATDYTQPEVTPSPGGGPLFRVKISEMCMRLLRMSLQEEAGLCPSLVPEASPLFLLSLTVNCVPSLETAFLPSTAFPP